jgi:hypothetical protein
VAEREPESEGANREGSAPTKEPICDEKLVVGATGKLGSASSYSSGSADGRVLTLKYISSEAYSINLGINNGNV